MRNIFFSFTLIFCLLMACGGDKGVSSSDPQSFLGSWRLATLTDLEDFVYNGGEIIPSPPHLNSGNDILIEGTLGITQGRFVMDVPVLWSPEGGAFGFHLDVSGNYAISGTTVTVTTERNKVLTFGIGSRSSQLVLTNINRADFENEHIFWKEMSWEKI